MRLETQRVLQVLGSFGEITQQEICAPTGAPRFGKFGIQANGFAAVGETLRVHPQSVITASTGKQGLR